MFDDLADPRLTRCIGEPSPDARVKINAQIDDALLWLTSDPRNEPPDAKPAEQAAPWISDLVRGLHWQAIHEEINPTDRPSTGSMLEKFAEKLDRAPIDPAVRETEASSICLAWADSQDGIVDAIYGASMNHLRSRRAPWEDQVALGYGIRLVLERLERQPRSWSGAGPSSGADHLRDESA